MTTVAEKKAEDWMTSKWRPLMAITYMATIWFDFILGPILFNILQYYNPGQAVTSWTPLTLQGGGLYHLSMGAILGIAAWTRGKEKVAAIENGGGGGAPQGGMPGFNGGFGTAPDTSVPQQAQWLDPAAAAPAAPAVTPTVTDPIAPPVAPTVTDTVEVVTEAPVVAADAQDPNRPRRRRKIS